jgi:hypothetical protein
MMLFGYNESPCGNAKHEGAMPHYHLFKQSAGTAEAVTDDAIGEKLPRLRSETWVHEKEVTINHGGGPFIGADSDDVIEGVETEGYYLCPQSKDKT